MLARERNVGVDYCENDIESLFLCERELEKVRMCVGDMKSFCF